MGKLGKECYPNETCDKGLRCDTDNNVCVEDPENPINDSDRTDSGSDIEPDTGSDSDGGDSAPDNGDTTPDNGDLAPDSGDSEPDDTDTAPDNGDSTPDSDNDSSDSAPDSDETAPANDNPDNLPECSPTSTTPCIDSETVNSDSGKINLIWSGKSPERLRWVDAVDYCKNLNEGGYSDWQIPTIAALRTLLTCESYYCSSANSDGKNSKFGDIAFFWSATQGQGIDFYTGKTQTKNDAEAFDVRCVRKEVTTRFQECPELEFENADYYGQGGVNGVNVGWDWNDLKWLEFQYWLCIFECEDNICKDPSSSLSWLFAKASNGKMTWNDAVSYCDNLTEGGYSDWRLPNISELRTLIRNCNRNEIPDGSCGVIDTGDPSTSCLSSDCWTSETCGSCENGHSTGKYSKFGDRGGYFWSSSTYVYDTDYAWCVDFDGGGVSYYNKTNSYYVRCVR